MLDIQNKISFEDNLWLGLVNSSNINSSEENRIKAVTDIASISKGRLGFHEPKTNSDVSKARKRLYSKLLKESAGSPSIPFEFIPTAELIFDYSESDGYLKYGITDNEVFYSNFRNYMSKYKTYSIINNNQRDVKDFKIIIGKLPIKVLSHLRTHRAFSFIIESSRNKKYLNEVEFWYPSWWNSVLQKTFKEMDLSNVSQLKNYIDSKTILPEEATMELSDRRLVTFAMAAWKQDINAWDNLFAVRGNKTGTMSITGIVTDKIKSIYN